MGAPKRVALPAWGSIPRSPGGRGSEPELLELRKEMEDGLMERQAQTDGCAGRGQNETTRIWTAGFGFFSSFHVTGFRLWYLFSTESHMNPGASWEAST